MEKIIEITDLHEKSSCLVCGKMQKRKLNSIVLDLGMMM